MNLSILFEDQILQIWNSYRLKSFMTNILAMRLNLPSLSRKGKVFKISHKKRENVNISHMAENRNIYVAKYYKTIVHVIILANSKKLSLKIVFLKIQMTDYIKNQERSEHL